MRSSSHSRLGNGPRLAGVAVAILLGTFLAVPSIATFYKSFMALDPARPFGYGTFLGFDNYISLLRHEPEFWTSLWASLWFVVLSGAQCLGAMGFAAWLRFLWPRRLPRLLVVALFTPLLVSPTCLGLIGRLYLNDQIGLLTKVLRLIGILSEGDAPLATSHGAWTSLLLLDSWQWTPFVALLFWFTFQLVPMRQIEVARIDGLTIPSRIRYLYLPRLATPFAAIFLIRLLEALRTFELPQVLTGGGPGTATLMSSLYANRVTFVQQRFGVGAAHLILLETLATIIILILISRIQAFRARIREVAR